MRVLAIERLPFKSKLTTNTYMIENSLIVLVEFLDNCQNVKILDVDYANNVLGIVTIDGVKR